MKLLLVEDEVRLSQIITKGLKKLSYAVDCAYDGQEALDLFEINIYDLIILDINLPILDGFSVLRQIRSQNREVKVIILSAKNTTPDKINGLDLGANDYLEKPFDFLELEARIRNLLRWSFTSEIALLSIGPLTIDTAAKTVTVRDHALSFTNKEYGILEYLAHNCHKYTPAEEIIEHVWSSDADPFSNSFKFHIHSIKKKLGDAVQIETIRGKGYKISHE